MPSNDLDQTTAAAPELNRSFASRRLDLARVMPESFLEEFRQKDSGTRRFLLNALTLFAAVSSEQQHQAINDLIQSEIIILSDRSREFLRRRVRSILQRFQIEKEATEADVREYYYRYYILTGAIPERLTPDYLNLLLKFIVGIELIKLIFSMSSMQQQRFFELQGKYSTQAMLFYRYIKPIRNKLDREKLVPRDRTGHRYYSEPTIDPHDLLDFVFDTFDLETIVYLGECAEKLAFEYDYIHRLDREEIEDLI